MRAALAVRRFRYGRRFLLAAVAGLEVVREVGPTVELLGPFQIVAEDYDRFRREVWPRLWFAAVVFWINANLAALLLLLNLIHDVGAGLGGVK